MQVRVYVSFLKKVLFSFVIVVWDSFRDDFEYILYETVYSIRLKGRNSHPDVFCKKGVLRNFADFTGKHLCQSLFFKKVAGPATLLKKRLWHRGFPVNFAKFLRTSFIIEHLWWLLLSRIFSRFLTHSSVCRFYSWNAWYECPSLSTTGTCVLLLELSQLIINSSSRSPTLRAIQGLSCIAFYYNFGHKIFCYAISKDYRVKLVIWMFVRASFLMLLYGWRYEFPEAATEDYL